MNNSLVCFGRLLATLETVVHRAREGRVRHQSFDCGEWLEVWGSRNWIGFSGPLFDFGRGGFGD